MSNRARVLDHFLQRLGGSISRSPLLKASTTKTGRLLDCSELEVVSADLPQRMLTAILQGKGAVAINFNLRGSTNEPAPVNRDHAVLYELLEKRIRRHAELAKRETGVHCVWFGYPLLYVPTDDRASGKWILAPMFLWPIAIEMDFHREGRLRIGRFRQAENKDAVAPQFNLAMSMWIQRELNFGLTVPTEEQLEEMNWGSLQEMLRSIAKGFQDLQFPEMEASLQSVPDAKAAASLPHPRLYHAAVLGYFRTPNESIMEDLAAIRGMQSCPDVIGAFTEGTVLRPPPAHPPPAEEDRYFVSDMDFSQERAVWQARTEPGLVIHGPPGTGKSQTIVNIIADALAHRQTVLMVCQKQAATRVVLERLRKEGLASLCLEVHDTEMDRLPVFKAIREQVDQLPTGVPSEVVERRQELSVDVSRLEAELDNYAKALNERHPKFGLSYCQTRAREGKVFGQFPAVRGLPTLQPIVAGLSAQQLDALCTRVRDAGDWFDKAAFNNNPWKDRRPDLQVIVSLREDVRNALLGLRRLDADHIDFVRRRSKGMPLPPNRADFMTAGAEVLCRLERLATEKNPSRDKLTRTWLKSLRTTPVIDPEAKRKDCQALVNLANEVAKAPLEPAWHTLGLHDGELPVLRRGAEKLLAMRGRWWRAFSLSFHRRRSEIQRLLPNAHGASLWELAESLQAYCHARALRARLAAASAALVPPVRPVADDEKALRRFPGLALECFEQACWLCEQEKGRPWVSPLIDAFLSQEASAFRSQYLTDVKSAVERSRLVQALFRALSDLKQFLSERAFAEPASLMLDGRSIADWLGRVEKGIDGLEALIALDSYRKDSDDGLRATIAALLNYEDRRTRGETVPEPGDIVPAEYGRWWEALVRFTAALTWRKQWEQQQPLLLRITPDVHAAKVSQLRDLLKQKQNLEANTITARWLERQVSYRNEPWARMFQMKASKNGESKRLREAVRLALPAGLLALRPCWLVNPTVVSQLFPLDPHLFDVVIFDEASQCPIEQAIPAIYRGRRLVVAGDGKQLPPTSFFSSRSPTTAENSADQDEEATDEPVRAHQRILKRLNEDDLLRVEDLLEGSIGTLPESFLKVHYRSQDPALIQFSNHAFYSGELEAPPTRAGKKTPQRPLLYHEVSGTYTRRSNQKEALRVVELLKHLWLKEARCPTVGVVTFNQPQRELIEDLIEEACEQDPSFAARFQQERHRQEANQDVGFFVKNLENVQGDERDVMIFSTTFGRDSSGQFYRRFGPVAASGGERRLNVAVTRAKSQIYVVGSMPISEVSTVLQPTNGVGAQLTPRCYLQLYLAYAKAVSDADFARIQEILQKVGAHAKQQRSGVGETESPLEDEVHDEIQKLGYQVECQLGDSGFRIDLAVLHPDPLRGYVLGIECDGAAYHSNRSARTRDVWRQSILEARGWRFHRIWSSQWWQNRSQELAKLKLAIERSVQYFQ